MHEALDKFDPLRYWEQRIEQFDLAAVGYRSLGLQFNRWPYRLRRRLFRRAVRRLHEDWKGARVLDIGSGTGFYVSEWLRLGASVIGIDLTNAAVARLQGLFPEQTFIQGDVSDALPIAPASFDAVSAFDVLFHIVDDGRYRNAIRNISSALKDGGYVLFSENFVHSATVSAPHVASRPLRLINALLEEAGLEVVARRPMFVLMNAPVDSRSRVLWLYWSLLERVLARFPSLGSVIGALLYPLELLLIATRTEGPSTELMICRKHRAC